MVKRDRKEVVTIIHGSHLYGLNTEASDTDYKRIVLPSEYDILTGNTDFSITESTGSEHSRNTPEDVDIETFSLQRFVRLAARGEMVALDMLHSEDKHIVSGDALYIWSMLRGNRELFYTKSLKSYIQYCRKQAAKYGLRGGRLEVAERVYEFVKNSIKFYGEDERLSMIFGFLPVTDHSRFVELPEMVYYEVLGRKLGETIKLSTAKDILEKIVKGFGQRAIDAKENKGIDWKAVSHAYRVGVQAREIFEHGGFKYPLPDTDFILKIKNGELGWESDVKTKLENLIDSVIKMSEESNLPDEVDQTIVEGFFLQAHKTVLGVK